MLSINSLIILTIISVVYKVTAFQIRDEKKADVSDNIANLVQAVTNTLQRLWEGKTGAEAKDLLTDIADRAEELLKDAGKESNGQPLSQGNNGTVEGDDSKDGRGVVVNILAIKVRATSIIREIDNRDITFIKYQQSSDDNSGVARARRDNCFGIHLGKHTCWGWRFRK